MKLHEFIDKIKNLKNGELLDIPALDKQDPNKCAICKKAFKKGDDIVSDLSGVVVHRDCFDKETGNDELKQRRTDNQLPYEDN